MIPMIQIMNLDDLLLFAFEWMFVITLVELVILATYDVYNYGRLAWNRRGSLGSGVE